MYLLSTPVTLRIGATQSVSVASAEKTSRIGARRGVKTQPGRRRQDGFGEHPLKQLTAPDLSLCILILTDGLAVTIADAVHALLPITKTPYRWASKVTARCSSVVPGISSDGGEAMPISRLAG